MSRDNYHFLIGIKGIKMDFIHGVELAVRRGYMNCGKKEKYINISRVSQKGHGSMSIRFDAMWRAIWGFLWCLPIVWMITWDLAGAIIVSAALVPWMILGWAMYARVKKNLRWLFGGSPIFPNKIHRNHPARRASTIDMGGKRGG